MLMRAWSAGSCCYSLFVEIWMIGMSADAKLVERFKFDPT